MRRTLLLAVLVGLLAGAVPAGASATTCRPLSEGGMVFPEIHESEDPEDYCFEVQLWEGQKLRQIDETRAAVYYTEFEPEHVAFVIEAVAARDAIGSSVPTTLAVTGPDIVTLTVHHRAGNPATGGAPFDYPIVVGAGWEGGFEPVEIKGPPDESELKPKPPLPVVPAESSYPHCEVPRLRGKSFRGAQRALWKSHCRVGSVHGKYIGTRVMRQYQPPGAVLPLRTQIGLKLR